MVEVPWKERCLDTHPLSNVEKHIVNAIEEAGSTGTYQHALGFSMTSMRTELAGGIAALAADGPVHSLLTTLPSSEKQIT